MLTINAFRPVNNNYSAQNQSNSNFRKTQFQSGADSCSFKAKIIPQEDKGQWYISQYLARYSDILGENFKTLFSKQFGQFLSDNGLMVEYAPITTNVTVQKHSQRGDVDYYLGCLKKLDASGNFVHLLNVDGLTKEDINVRFIRSILDSKTNLRISDELRDTTMKIGNAIDKFWSDWQVAIDVDRDFDANAKAKALQKALSKLMPEK